MTSAPPTLQHRLAQLFELGRGGEAANMRPMEGLRGFAVFLVFLVHFATLIKPWILKHPALQAFAEMLHSIGNTGVDLFFVLSGYLIYGSLIARPQPFVSFMSRRIRRIYPAFAVVFALYIALSALFPAENKIPGPATAALWYLLQNFLLLPGIFDIEPMITVAWSLSYELFYYLSIPLLIVACGLRERSPAQRIAFFAALTVLTLVYCAMYGGHVRLIMFLSGVLLHEVMQHVRSPAPSGWAGGLALLAGLLVTLLPLRGTAGHALEIGVLFIAFFILCLTCFRDPGRWLPTAFSWTPLRWLGNMSYSYYLLHGLALKAAFFVLAAIVPTTVNGHAMFWLMLPAMFVLTLVPSAVLFAVVEKPLSLNVRPSRAKRLATGGAR